LSKIYKILFTKQAFKDVQSLAPKLRAKLKAILSEAVCKDPLSGKKLCGDLNGNYSWRLDLKNRIVYSVDKKKKIIYVKRAKTHYGN
jgi:mRNA interferase RelE/StbE